MDRTRASASKLSENLSSDSLFTFTSKLDYLLDMLKNGIKSRYIYERIPIRNKTWYYIIAAKCFCDIPLGKIKSHLDWFGNYGLGIDKKYLMDKGTSPVIYMHFSSNYIINSLIKDGINNLQEHPTLPFLKRHLGADFKKLEDGSLKRSQRNFYDEREWRYVPEQTPIVGDDISTIEEGLDRARKMNNNKPFNGKGVSIKPDIINYLIVDRFEDFQALKPELRKIYKNDDEYELMLSKILIAQRIVRDF